MQNDSKSEEAIAFFFWCGLIILCGLSLFFFNKILFPFFFGLFLARLCYPAVLLAHRCGISNRIAVPLLTCIFFFVIFWVFSSIIPLLVDSFRQLSLDVPVFAEKIKSKLLLFHDYKVGGFSVAWFVHFVSAVIGNFFSLVSDGDHLPPFIQNFFSHILAMANFFYFILLVPVVTFYALRDWKLIQAGFYDLLPLSSQLVCRNFFEQLWTQLFSFLRCQMMLSCIIFVYYYVCLSLMDLNYALLIAIITGFFSFIPYVASTVGFTLSILVGVSQFTDYFYIGLLCALFLGGQLFEGFVLGPLIFENEVGLHPLAVLCSVFIFGSMFGFFGLLFSIPLLIIVRQFLQLVIIFYKKSFLFR